MNANFSLKVNSFFIALVANYQRVKLLGQIFVKSVAFYFDVTIHNLILRFHCFKAAHKVYIINCLTAWTLVLVIFLYCSVFLTHFTLILQISVNHRVLNRFIWIDLNVCIGNEFWRLVHWVWCCNNKLRIIFNAWVHNFNCVILLCTLWLRRISFICCQTHHKIADLYDKQKKDS